MERSCLQRRDWQQAHEQLQLVHPPWPLAIKHMMNSSKTWCLNWGKCCHKSCEYWPKDYLQSDHLRHRHGHHRWYTEVRSSQKRFFPRGTPAKDRVNGVRKVRSKTMTQPSCLAYHFIIELSNVCKGNITTGSRGNCSFRVGTHRVCMSSTNARNFWWIASHNLLCIIIEW